jgi:redox-sensitive bicupin YhaK (pirin superfamily)
MLTLRPAAKRGHANHGWLDTWHSFSFADYYDPAQMGFRDLRVINEDVIAAAAGFPTHGHRDMEIVTYMVDGALAHKDSTGGEGVIRRGDVQAMTAGTGVRHSEFNPSHSEKAKLLQIWILPRQDGLAPAYRQKSFADDSKENTLKLLVSEDGREGSLAINQDVSIFASLLKPGATVTHRLAPRRGAWVQLVDGALEVNGRTLGPGDAVAIEAEPRIEITAREPSELLLFDLA